LNFPTPKVSVPELRQKIQVQLRRLWAKPRSRWPMRRSKWRRRRSRETQKVAANLEGDLNNVFRSS
jgi:hypothetical protein